MFTFALAAKLFEGFSVLRWNDRLRPIELVEMDRCAYKASMAYIVGKELECTGNKINWNKIIDGIIYDMLRKIATSDIHSKVSSKLKDNKEVYAHLTKYIVETYQKHNLELKEAFINSFRTYLNNENLDSIESKILYFCHKYSSQREFLIIEKFNDMHDIPKIREEINEDLAKVKELKDIFKLHEKNGPVFELLEIVEKLRFQTRWSQTPRVPATNVLGHSMYAAALVYFLNLEINANATRAANNFFAALFHDLPESLTRDILSPVKRSSDEIDSQIKKIEVEMVREHILNKTNEKWRDHFEHLLGMNIETNDEFCNRIILNGRPQVIDSSAMENYNMEECNAVDGELVELCDKIATFMEAYMSIRHGIVSKHLESGKNTIQTKYSKMKIQGINVGDFFDDVI